MEAVIWLLVGLAVGVGGAALFFRQVMAPELASMMTMALYMAADRSDNQVLADHLIKVALSLLETDLEAVEARLRAVREKEREG